MNFDLKLIVSMFQTMSNMLEFLNIFFEIWKKNCVQTGLWDSFDMEQC